MDLPLNHVVAAAFYIGPDALMPVASAIAAIVGFLLMFWHRTVAWTKRVLQAINEWARHLLGRR